jgi:hypothetical protein
MDERRRSKTESCQRCPTTLGPGRAGDAPAAAARTRAYPAAAHNVELRPTAGPTADALRVGVAEAFSADPRCRRVVYAVLAGNAEIAETAREAGFRHVVDVDLADEELELWVVEPTWVTTTDMDLDHVPGS